MISIRGLHKNYEKQILFKDFNLSFEDHKITGILGPSGIGKTTLINLIAGLVNPDSGSIEGIYKQDISYIFQEPRLLPWLTVKENLSFTLKHIYQDESIRDKIIVENLKSVDLIESQNKFPNQLSGGMRQRVAIARAFAYPSQIMIMDEPFKGLDLKMKQSIISVFLDLWAKSQRTVIFVTHDVDEILSIVDTVHIISGNPVDVIYSKHIEKPRNLKPTDTLYQTLKDQLTIA
jgi:NitT/TauT family transport system ATP-binding protein